MHCPHGFAFSTFRLITVMKSFCICYFRPWLIFLGGSNFHFPFLVLSVFLLNFFFFFVLFLLQPVLSRSSKKVDAFETKEANVTDLGSWASCFFSKTNVSHELKASSSKCYLFILGSLRLSPRLIYPIAS